MAVALHDGQHKAHALHTEVADVIAGACGYCAQAFHANGQLTLADVHLIEEFEGHPSTRGLVNQGYPVRTL